jgi:hypothetical protein
MGTGSSIAKAMCQHCLGHGQAVGFVPVFVPMTGTNAKPSSQASVFQQLTTRACGGDGEDRSPGTSVRCTIPFAAYRVSAAIIASFVEMGMLVILLFPRRALQNRYKLFDHRSQKSPSSAQRSCRKN